MVKKLHSAIIKNEYETKQIKHPKCISSSSQAIITIVTMNEYISIEPFHDCNIVGRFTLRSKGKTIAFGTCEKIID